MPVSETAAYVGSPDERTILYETRRRFKADFEAKITLEAISRELTISELATKHQLHPSQITQWKWLATENLAEAIDDTTADTQVGREVEVRSSVPRSDSDRRAWIGGE